MPDKDALSSLAKNVNKMRLEDSDVTIKTVTQCSNIKNKENTIPAMVGSSELGENDMVQVVLNLVKEGHIKPMIAKKLLRLEQELLENKELTTEISRSGNFNDNVEKWSIHTFQKNNRTLHPLLRIVSTAHFSTEFFTFYILQ